MLAFTFPGQGSQRSGMGRPWVDHPSWEVVAEASAAIGRDVERLLLDAPMEELTQTANAQLATFVQSLVVLDAVERVGLSPAACAGHSLGEYSALVAAGAMPFSEGAALVVARGDAMAHAGEDAPGTMAALIGIADDDAEAACHRAEGEVWVANYNAPGQVVVAGTSDAVATASEIARELGARKVLALPVSGAFHTPLMAAARPALRKALGDIAFSAPEVPVVANVDARVHSDPSEWPGLLSAQLCGPVRWRQTIETLSGLGATIFVEVGPGGVLTGLVRRSAPEAQALSVAKPDDLDALLDVVAGGSGAASASGGTGGTGRAGGPEGGAAATLTDPWHDTHVHQGEHLYMSERVVVSPCSGIFAPEQSLAAPGTGLLPGTAGHATDPSHVRTGDLVGRVGITEVRTPFEGEVIRWLSVAGERVQEGQPLVWLRSGSEGG
ncbi:MAG TPA: ACP S-malonyltransferase [Acidimicrobiales bacterium]|nr:ACP S-malonyltransferase [Acidimicrobiales bacterium]